MKVKVLLESLEEFYEKLLEHQKLWGSSLHGTIPDYPIRNAEALIDQSKWLSRKLGALRPYIIRFDSIWIMQDPTTGMKWDALAMSVGTDGIAQIKGQSLRSSINKLDQIIGRLQSLELEDDIPEDTTQPIRPGAGVDNFILGYLHHLHPYISKGCSRLFLDGHYASAVEEAAKAVFQYIREKTNLTGDGATLAQEAFSVNKPILSFSDLADETKKSEQIGFMEMLKGFAKGVRNPLAHIHAKQEEAQKAFEYLVMASLFCRRIDDACSIIE